MSQPPVPMDDGWLVPFLPRLSWAGMRVLELGCGPGNDARRLLDAGFEVFAFDRQPVSGARERAPAAHFFRADLGRPLPLRTGMFDAAIASLSLHYLPWTETLGAVAEVRRVLRPGGVFLFRVNATDDIHHGAGQGVELEPNYFTAAPGSWAEAKRFFNEASIREATRGLFAIEHLEHRTIHRYEQPKQVWECLAISRETD